MSDEPVRILIVDDSRFLFRSARWRTRCAISRVSRSSEIRFSAGEKAALAAIRESPPDLVTLDVEMPRHGRAADVGADQAFNRSRWQSGR